MIANDIGYLQINVPFGVGSIEQAGGNILVGGFVFQLVVDRYRSGSTGAMAELVLINVIVLQRELPAGLGCIAHGGITA